VLHTALMVTKMLLSLGCAKSSAAYDQSLSLGLRDGATDAAYVTQSCRTAGHGPRHMGLLGRVTVDVYLEVADVLSGLMSSSQTQISQVVQTCQPSVGTVTTTTDRRAEGRSVEQTPRSGDCCGADWCRSSFGNSPA